MAEGRRARACAGDGGSCWEAAGCRLRACICVCLCVPVCVTCVCQGEEAESSAKPFEFYSMENSPISQVQTLNLNYFLTLCY